MFCWVKLSSLHMSFKFLWYIVWAIHELALTMTNKNWLAVVLFMKVFWKIQVMECFVHRWWVCDAFTMNDILLCLLMYIKTTLWCTWTILYIFCVHYHFTGSSSAGGSVQEPLWIYKCYWKSRCWKSFGWISSKFILFYCMILKSIEIYICIFRIHLPVWINVSCYWKELTLHTVSCWLPQHLLGCALDLLLY